MSFSNGIFTIYGISFWSPLDFNQIFLLERWISYYLAEPSDGVDDTWGQIYKGI